MQHKIIDLTHLLHNEIPVYPETEKPIFKQLYNIVEHRFAETELNMLSHHGTHMDAPSHMIKNGKNLDEFEIEHFYGKAICIDCTGIDRTIINLEVLLHYEKRIKKVDYVLLNSGWSKKWGTKAYFSGFPVLTVEACQWLSNFKLKGIGLDYISLDDIDTQDFANHFIILGKGMVIIENLCNLNLLGNKIFKFSCFPLNYENADGAPVRAVAFL